VLALFQALVHIVLIGAAFAQLLLTYCNSEIHHRLAGNDHAVRRRAAAVCRSQSTWPVDTSVGAACIGPIGELHDRACRRAPASINRDSRRLVRDPLFNSRNERRNLVGMRILARVLTVVFFL
jgi:hypothetical protein